VLVSISSVGVNDHALCDLPKEKIDGVVRRSFSCGALGDTLLFYTREAIKLQSRGIRNRLYRGSAEGEI